MKHFLLVLLNYIFSFEIIEASLDDIECLDYRKIESGFTEKYVSMNFTAFNFNFALLLMRDWSMDNLNVNHSGSSKVYQNSSSKCTTIFLQGVLKGMR